MQVLMYKNVMKGENNPEKDIRLPLEGERLKAWEEMLVAKNITQLKALYTLIDWFLSQDDLVQSLVLRQIAPRKDLVAMVLKKLEHDAATSQYRGWKSPPAKGSPANKD